MHLYWLSIAFHRLAHSRTLPSARGTSHVHYDFLRDETPSRNYFQFI
jgi:hypothetical protein